MNQIAELNKLPKIAIIGSGISGLASAYGLIGIADITVFEKESRFGGHARTILAGKDGNQPVDTGFIVYNYANYPHLTRMFKDLDVPVKKSDMSFGASIAGGKLEYALRNLNSIFAQRRNIFKPKMYKMIKDILKFGQHAESIVENSENISTGEMLDILDVGDWFMNYYLLPICGAIWSTPPSKIRDFPAQALVSFFRNHALLEAGAQHQWWTVDGGSIEYVNRLTQYLKNSGVELRAGTPVLSVNRYAHGVKITTHLQKSERFDAIIFACHSDEALQMLSQPTQTEMSALSDLKYQDNHVVLHADISQMPKNKSCWASWVYQSDGQGNEAQIGVTYWMNKLQTIPDHDPMFVTLNPAKKIDENLIYDIKTFRHPVFDFGALKAQKTIDEIQGQNNTWFAGAYLRHGFHEDGFASAVRVTDRLKADLAVEYAI